MRKRIKTFNFFLNIFCQKEWRVLCKMKKRNVSKKSKIHHNWHEKSGLKKVHLKKMKHRKDRHWQNNGALSFVLLFIIIMLLDIIQFKLIVWTWVRVTFDWNVLSSKKEFHPTDVTAKLAVKEWFLI